MKESKKIEEALAENGFVLVPVHGTSKRPMLHQAQVNEYLVLGDHQYKEKEKIHLSQIIGCVSEYWTGGKQIQKNSFGYRIYHAIWNGNLMIRRIVLALLRLSGND